MGEPGKRAGKRTARTADLRQRALDLRIAGASYERIAGALEISKRSAWRHVQAALAEASKHATDTAERIREMELRRLDTLLVALWPKKGDPRAADTIMRGMERRARYLGLDAPSQVNVTGKGGGPIEFTGYTDSERALAVDAVLEAARERRARQDPPSADPLVPVSGPADGGAGEPG